MPAAGLALAGCKQAIGELLAVVSQELVEPDWAGLVRLLGRGRLEGVEVAHAVAAPDTGPALSVRHRDTRTHA